MEEIMRRDLMGVTLGHYQPRIDSDLEELAIVATELSKPAPRTADPAEIFRRLDRPPPRRPAWMTAVAIGVLAIAATLGVIAYQVL
jgi:hypothetical protein